jgi:hypothetical protein
MCVRTRLLTSVLWLATACGFPRPADVPEPITCTPNEFLKCDGRSLLTCNASGDAADSQDCGVAGCNADASRCNQCVPKSDSCGANPNEIDHCGADGLPAGKDNCALACTSLPSTHCSYLEPRYLPDVCDSVARLPALTVMSSGNFDANLDNNCTGGVVSQSGGAPLCVVRHSVIRIAANATLTVTGARPIAFVADDELTIDGVLDISAKGTIDGPGGGAFLSGDQALNASGGGGAGFKTNGANGGNATTDGGGGLGGPAAMDPSLLTVLAGGTRARSPGALQNGGVSGGGGGGATLIACRGRVFVTGTIASSGGGGQGGFDRFFGGTIALVSGGGGGAGGNVAIQGAGITVTGQVFANGGGGGAGVATNDGDGQPGADGTRSATTPASGGISLGPEGSGGAGGIQGTAPGVGLHPPATGATAGGGGGSVGFFQTYTPAGIAPALAPSMASPSFNPNKAIKTR